MRKTKAHNQILIELEKSHHPITVASLSNRFSANKSTFYRQLKKMCVNGIVTKVEFGDGKVRYESANNSHHHHVVCDECGKIEEITFSESRLFNHVKSSYKILRHSLEFFGLCQPCQTKYV